MALVETAHGSFLIRPTMLADSNSTYMGQVTINYQVCTANAIRVILSADIILSADGPLAFGIRLQHQHPVQLPGARLAVRLPGGPVRRRQTGDLELRVALQQLNESLAHGARGPEDPNSIPFHKF